MRDFPGSMRASRRNACDAASGQIGNGAVRDAGQVSYR
jgi:hypothetical protein